MHNKDFAAIDTLCVNAIRALSIDMIQKANSGHPGLPLGAAPMTYVLWTRFLKHNAKNPAWYNRDRFILSAGHGSALLYSLLHLNGYDVSLQQLQQFRQWGSMTPGHPEEHLTPGVELSTGPLGQGFANGVGMAVAEAYLAAHYNRPEHDIIDHYIYALVSDGDLMEGISAEAASLAGHLRLGKLIYLYDDNHICLSGSTHLHFTEDRAARFATYGWHTETIEDGNDLDAIAQAIGRAQQETQRPSLLLVKTTIGYGSPHKQNTFQVHGAPLGEQEVKLTKRQLGYPEAPPFHVPEEVYMYFNKVIEAGEKNEAAWHTQFARYAKEYPDVADELKQLMQGKLAKHWDENIPQFSADVHGISTRVAGGKVMQSFAAKLPGFIGGSADLNPSTGTALINYGNFQAPQSSTGDQQGAVEGGWHYKGRNIFYGVREHAMGAMSSGIATYQGMLPYTATFFTFADYMRPAFRLAAMSKHKIVYVFTHDSIAVGEDGATHQPVEHLASLRAIPQFTVIRPADANEVAEAWRIAIGSIVGPVALVLTRQNLPVLDRTRFASAKGLHQGAYILDDAENTKPDIILLATGSEVQLIVAAKERLAAQGVAARIVSMPSWELFAAQPQAYRDSVLPLGITKRLVVEAGVRQGWDRYIGEHGAMIGIEKFGVSAPGTKVMQAYGFTVENVYQQAMVLLGKTE